MTLPGIGTRTREGARLSYSKVKVPPFFRNTGRLLEKMEEEEIMDILSRRLGICI